MTDYESPYMKDRGHKCKKSAQGMGKEFVAGGTIVAGTFVKFSGADDITVVTCGAKGALIGVAMNDATVGQDVMVQMDGYHWIIVGTAASLAPGDWVESDANGMAVEMDCGGGDSFLGGYVLSTPTDDEDCVCMKIQPCPLCETQRG